MEAVFQNIKGVESVTSGYAGGLKLNPTYEEVNSGATGHTEVVKIIFDPAAITINQLLTVFFATHDPTTLDRQGNDVGPQYRSAIFYTTPGQGEAVTAFVKKLASDMIFPRPIVTEIKPFNTFFPAERYHQNYYRNNIQRSYCQVVINPKLVKLRSMYEGLVRE